jgi:hypothetical protein
MSNTDKRVTRMLKKVCFALFLLSTNTHADNLSSLQIKMAQNRVIKSTNVKVVLISVCDALMDLGQFAGCNGINTWDQINSGIVGLDLKKLLDEAQYVFGSTYGVTCGKNLCTETVQIRVTKINSDTFKVNIKITSSRKGEFDSDSYRRYFEAIGNSLFLNKTGVQLGELSE